jgi:hypothetical protein
MDNSNGTAEAINGDSNARLDSAVNANYDGGEVDAKVQVGD